MSASQKQTAIAYLKLGSISGLWGALSLALFVHFVALKLRSKLPRLTIYLLVLAFRGIDLDENDDE